jgi:glutamate N-acetyltransferase/amino-acid N-acetyltransferase
MSRQQIFPVAGIRLATVASGIRYKERDDLVAIELPEQNASCAAVFTRNAFCAAPVIVAKEHLSASTPRFLLINSGNANAGTGDSGLRASRETCKSLATAAGCALNQVLPFSTGVIGQDLPTDKIAHAISGLLEKLDENHWSQAAHAIMTTDTVAKVCSRQIDINSQTVTVTGICKGSGMIHPDMATMLAFIATDAGVDRQLLQNILSKAVLPSFNSITVDGDTSTNDACVLIASGASGVVIDDDSEAEFSAVVTEVCIELARAIILDGEGATKLVTITIENAFSEEEARTVGFTIAHSPLVKTALFASDPNWGRILAAVGRAGIDDLDIDTILIWLDDVCIVSHGGRDPGYTEADGQRVMNQSELMIKVDLKRGQSQASILTCDLSFDYVKINAEYRT